MRQIRDIHQTVGVVGVQTPVRMQIASRGLRI